MGRFQDFWHDRVLQADPELLPQKPAVGETLRKVADHGIRGKDQKPRKERGRLLGRGGYKPPRRSRWWGKPAGMTAGELRRELWSLPDDMPVLGDKNTPLQGVHKDRKGVVLRFGR